MFTQMGLTNLWVDLNTGLHLSNCDIQIICDSEQERCMKIYLSFERRYAYFSSTRLSSEPGTQFSIWIRKNDWQPLEGVFEREASAADSLHA